MGFLHSGLLVALPRGLLCFPTTSFLDGESLLASLLVAPPLWAPRLACVGSGHDLELCLYRATLECGFAQWPGIDVILVIVVMRGTMPLKPNGDSSYRWLPPLEIWWTYFGFLDLGFGV